MLLAAGCLVWMHVVIIDRRPFLTLLARSPRILANVLVGLSGKLREVSREAFDLAVRKGEG